MGFEAFYDPSSVGERQRDIAYGAFCSSDCPQSNQAFVGQVFRRNASQRARRPKLRAGQPMMIAFRHFPQPLNIVDKVPYGLISAGDVALLIPKNIKLIPAEEIANDLDIVPEAGGVYLFFLKGGAGLLEATSYDLPPSAILLKAGQREHLYTGAARDLRRRMKQHLRRDFRGSSFRKTLHAIEFARKAISGGKGRPRLMEEDALSDWLRLNAVVGIQQCDMPFERECQMLSRFASPLNITFRRSCAYSKVLMAWRAAAFPRY